MMVKIKGIIFDWIGTLAKNSDEIFPYSERIVRRLSGRYRMSVISIAGFGIEKRCKEIKDSGLREYFDHVIVDTVKTQEQYLECIRKMEATPTTTAIVDDRAFRGIKIGNQLGCTTYWIRNGKYAHEIPNEETGKPHGIINSVEGLLGIL